MFRICCFVFFCRSLSFFFFFFSSRRRHTRLTCDWSSDVCSSDLDRAFRTMQGPRSREFPWRPGPESNRHTRICSPLHHHSATRPHRERRVLYPRSEERRVGKECRGRWWAEDEKKERRKMTE